MPGWRLSEVDPRSREAQTCLDAYYAELDRRFAGGFLLDQSHDPDVRLLLRPRGAFLVATLHTEPVGCVALKGTCPEYSEIKRMWVAPQCRGAGLARALMARAETVARELNVGVLRLDTNHALDDAIEIYRRWGWTEIPPFNDDPYAHVFFEKSL